MRLLALALLVAAPQAFYGADIVLERGTVVRLADAQGGGEILGRHDDFINALSPFDRSARLETKGPVSTEGFVEFVSRQALEFSGPEGDNLVSAVAGIRAALLRLDSHLPLPPTVYIVKTTGREEAGAAYHRGDAIILPREFLRLPPAGLSSVLSHELFHVLSARDGDLRRDLYALVGFEPCNDVPLPKDFADRKITNPDEPRDDFSIEVSYKGRSIRVMPVLFASTAEYDPSGGKSLFDYLQQRLMAVDQEDGRVVPSIVDGKPLMLEASAVPDYGRKLGAGIEYLIQPDEVLAVDFASLLAGKETSIAPGVLAGMKRLLSKGRSPLTEKTPRRDSDQPPLAKDPQGAD